MTSALTSERFEAQPATPVEEQTANPDWFVWAAAVSLLVSPTLFAGERKRKFFRHRAKAMVLRIAGRTMRMP
jgi:hypothetical protein